MHKVLKAGLIMMVVGTVAVSIALGTAPAAGRYGNYLDTANIHPVLREAEGVPFLLFALFVGLLILIGYAGCVVVVIGAALTTRDWVLNSLSRNRWTRPLTRYRVRNLKKWSDEVPGHLVRSRDFKIRSDNAERQVIREFSGFEVGGTAYLDWMQGLSDDERQVLNTRIAKRFFLIVQEEIAAEHPELGQRGRNSELIARLYG